MLYNTDPKGRAPFPSFADSVTSGGVDDEDGDALEGQSSAPVGGIQAEVIVGRVSSLHKHFGQEELGESTGRTCCS